MKAAAFAYSRATSVDNAIELLAAHGDRAKVLSGGQSLLPAMNLRLITPDLVVDIGHLAELRGIFLHEERIRIGALTRHVDLLKSPEIASCAPLLAEAAAHIAHPAIRNRGTLGGSLAHADPAAELPACMLALDASIIVRGTDGERRMAAADFFKGIFETALLPSDLLVAVELPVVPRHSIHFFREFSRRRGDYALAGLAAQAIVEADRFRALRMSFFAVGDRPVQAKAAGLLIDVAITPGLLATASQALGDELEFQRDQQATEAMRRHLVQALFVRCLCRLLGRPDLRLERTGA